MNNRYTQDFKPHGIAKYNSVRMLSLFKMSSSNYEFVLGKACRYPFHTKIRDTRKRTNTVNGSA
jgi:hypothetical protein